MRVMVVQCDWCLDAEPILDAQSVEFGGVTVDLCPAHVARWSDLQSGLGTPATPSASGRPASRRPARRASTPAETGERAAAQGEPGPAPRSRKARSSNPSSKRKATKAAGSSGSRSMKSRSKAKPEPLPEVDFGAVRAWASSRGIPVSVRGPVRREVVEQFLAAPVNAGVVSPTFRQP